MNLSFSRSTGKFMLALACALTLQQSASAHEYYNDVVYQVFTDRFYNGRKDNDDPAVSKGLFDSTRTNWKAYWGGDLAGVREKIPYIKSLGCTAIWISPCIDNINKPDNDAAGKMVAPYHGYHARDFMKVDEHFGDPENSFKDFDALIKTAHAADIKVFVDMPFNHTSPFNHAEYGALFDSGQYRGDVANDRNRYFHHIGPVVDDTNPYQLQYRDIFFLGDLNQENSYIDNYLRQSAAKFKSHGADGTRLDAAKHMNWGWQHLLTNELVKQSDHLVLGEWWLTGTDDRLYNDAIKYANKGGISLYDFPFAFAVRKALGQNGDFSAVARVIDKENSDFNYSNELLTFIDNHDMPRFLSLNPNNRALQLALATLMTCRGIPVIYYGTENGLHNDTAGGEDPYCRPFMESFDQSTDNYKLIQKLTQLRRANPALMAGAQSTILADKDVYVFKRSTSAQTAIVAINKSAASAAVDGATFGAALNVDDSPDALGVLSGVALNKSLKTLPPHSVSIWLKEKTSDSPYVYAVRPPTVSEGGELTIYGEFGDPAGETVVHVGNEVLKPSSSSAGKLVLRAPLLQHGELPLKVVVGGKESNQCKLHVMENNLVLATLFIKDLAVTPADKVFISGNAAALGAGSPDEKQMAGPMVFKQDEGENIHMLALPLPAGKTVDLKLVVKDAKGGLRSARSQQVHVPTGVGRVELKWEN